MKKRIWKKEWFKNVVFLAILGVLFFTPVGKWIRVQIQSVFLFSPSNEIEEESADKNVLDFPFQLMDADGNDFLLSEMEGKPIFINFYASWCGPCLAEFRSMQAMQDALPHIQFLFITREAEREYYKFIESIKYDYPFYMQKSRNPPEFEHESIPASFMLNAQGKLVYKHIGAANWSDEDIIEELDALSRS
jgi:thiol-disulfide isomerase/thioredoxin